MTQRQEPLPAYVLPLLAAPAAPVRRGRLDRLAAARALWHGEAVERRLPLHGDDDHHHDDHHHNDNHLEPMAARVMALETILTEKGLIDPAVLDRIVDTYETKVGPRNGARVVAKAWNDPAFANWLREDATAAVASLGYTGRQGEHLRAVFNTPDTHNLVVCTLCSCYPWSVLGLPPVWYKSPPYRSRAVLDPRGVLQEFGLDLPPSTAIRVWDSTAEVRYLVVPMRPEATDDLDEAALADLVSRDAMIGTALAGARP